jgi:hypothetical protein
MLDAMIRIDHDDGFVETRAHTAASWGAAAWSPLLDPAEPMKVAISAKNFRIAGLLPFVDRWLDELDGWLDADTRVEFNPKDRRVRLAGEVALVRGGVEALGGGGEFHDIAATARFAPDGTVTLEKLTAAGLSGRLQATGSARLDGPSLRSASLVLLIPSDSPIPLDLGGSAIGNVDGRVDVSEVSSSDGRTLNVNIVVPRMRVALPEGASKRALALSEIANVHIGAHRGPAQTFVVLPLDPKKRKPDESPSVGP